MAGTQTADWLVRNGFELDAKEDITNLKLGEFPLDNRKKASCLECKV